MNAAGDAMRKKRTKQQLFQANEIRQIKDERKIVESEGIDLTIRHRHTYYWGGIKWHEEVMGENVKERVKKFKKDSRYHGERKDECLKKRKKTSTSSRTKFEKLPIVDRRKYLETGKRLHSL